MKILRDWMLVVFCISKTSWIACIEFDHWKSIFWHNEIIWFFFPLSYHVFFFYKSYRFLIDPTRLVDKGGLASLYGMVWAICMWYGDNGGFGCAIIC